MDVGETVGAVVAGVIGLAIVSVLVSKNANTSGVITSAFSGLSSVVGAAVAPVSGGGASILGSNPLSMLAGGGLGMPNIGSIANIGNLGGIGSLMGSGGSAFDVSGIGGGGLFV